MGLFKNKLLIFVVFISLILLFVIGATVAGRNRPTPLEGVLGRIITPVQKFMYSTGQVFKNTFGGLFEIRNLKKENQLLNEEVIKLREKNRKLEQYAIENDKLRSILSFKQNNEQYKLVGADITGKDPGNWFDIYTIDKGINNGIEVNDAIVVENGFLVGRVIEVGSNYSKFMALIDQRSSVSIIVNRTRDQGIVQGSANSDIVAIMPIEADIVKGDEISTSSISMLPKDLYIGKVKSVEKQERKLQKLVLIEPAVDFDKLEKVFVIKNTLK